MRAFCIAVLLLVGCLVGMRETILQPLGLITRPNKYGQFPPGAMEVARNVVMRDKGILRGFPDAQSYRNDVLASGHKVYRLFPGSTSLLTFGLDGSTWAARWVTGASSTVITFPSFITFSSGTGKLHAVNARGRFIWTSSTDVMVADSEGDTTARYPGIVQPTLDIAVGSTATNGQALANNMYAGYRAIFKRTQSDGYVLTSPPSSQVIAFNTGLGATANVMVRAQIAFDEWRGIQAGDVVELYRTKSASTISVGDSHYLAMAATIAAGDITSGYIDILDVAPESGLTQELYTNPGQTSGVLSGAQRAEFPPPSSVDVATFKGHTFYVGVEVPAFYKTRIPGLLGTLSTTAERTYGIGIRTTTGDVTAASAAILNVANTTGLKAGQEITSGFFPGGTIIASVVGTTVTMNATSSGTSVGTGISFKDMIDVNGPIAITKTSEIELGIGQIVFSFPGARRIDTMGIINPNTGVDVLVRNYRNRDSAFGIRATNGQNYSPPLPEISASTVPSSKDPRTNRIHWSLLDQPEAVPQLSFAFVGNGVIYRIIPTRDALWIFASDGLFRLSGVGGVWRVDPVDPVLTLVTRKAVCVLGQDVWAYTNRGLVVISPEGLVTRVSEDLIGDVLPGAQFSDSWDTFMAADEKHSEVLLTIRTTTTSLTYVFNTRSGAFTTLEPASATAGQDIANDAFAITEMVAFPSSDTLAYGAATGSSGLDADVGTFVADTSANRFVGLAQVMRFQPVAPQGEPFSLVQFMDETWLFEDAETLVVTPTFGTIALSTVTIADGGVEDRLTVGVPRSAAIAQRLRPGLQLTTTAKNWSLRGLSMRWIPLSQQGKR